MMRRFRVLLCICLLLFVSPTVWAQSSRWGRHGPYGGRVLAIAFSPNAAIDATAYAGLESGGLFVSGDQGESWSPISGLDSHLTISRVVVSPAYVLDGTLLVSTMGAGVFKSWTRGEEWTSWSEGLGSLNVIQMAISPDYVADQTLLAATDAGLYRSTSGGKTWAPVGPTESALALSVYPRLEGGFVAYCGTVSGLSFTRDSGATWQPILTQGLPVTSLAISPNYDVDRSVLVGTLDGAYFTSNAGETWVGPWLDDLVIHAALFSPSFGSDNTLFLGSDDGVHLSTDGGVEWLRSAASQQGVNTLVAAPNYAATSMVLAGTDASGVIKSTTAGVTWNDANQGISSLDFSTVAISMSYLQDGTVFTGGSQGVWRSTQGGQDWALTASSPRGVHQLVCALDGSATSVVYAATEEGFFVSPDAGASWRAESEGLGVLDISAMAVGDSQELWAATKGGGVYSTTLDSLVWSSVSAGLPTYFITTIQWIVPISGPPRLVVGTLAHGVFVSEDGARSWMPADVQPASLGINDMASARGFDGHTVLYAGTAAGVYQSLDLGTTWQLDGLDDQVVLSVALHPNYAVRPNCYVGTRDAGVWLSSNGGLTWGAFNAGLGSMRVQDLAIATQSVNPVVFAATPGGVWRYGEPELPSYFQMLPVVLR